MRKIQEEFRTKVAQTIKDRRRATNRVQVNASFSKAEHRSISKAARSKGVPPARLIKDLTLQSIGNVPSASQAQLGNLIASIQETSQLLRTLYRDSNAWQRWELKELRPLLRRFLQFERKAASILDQLAKCGRAD